MGKRFKVIKCHTVGPTLIFKNGSLEHGIHSTFINLHSIAPRFHGEKKEPRPAKRELMLRIGPLVETMAESPSLPPIKDIHEGRGKFHEAITLLFEAAPPLAETLWQRRPYEDYNAIITVAETFLLDELLPIAQRSSDTSSDQIQALENVRIIINAHPRLGAPKTTLSALSQKEQSGGTFGVSSNQKAEAPMATAVEKLGELNKVYEATYGFRYVVFVNGRSRPALVPEFQDRLRQHPEINPESTYSPKQATQNEQRAAFQAMVDIARDRLCKLSIQTSSNL